MYDLMVEFSTKLDANGNRYYLGVDFDNKTFTQTPRWMYHRDEVTEIGKRARVDMIKRLKAAGFKEV